MVETIDLNKINRSDMARKTGVDVSHISRILAGKARPSLTLAGKMAKYMGMTLEELCAFLGIDK